MNPPLKKLVALVMASACALSLAVSDAHAAPKDKAAQKLYDTAMEDNYLTTEFDTAIKNLKKAIKNCGDKGCSKSMLGKLYVGLGVVYAGGKNDNKNAKDAFIKAFKADKNAKPLEDFMSDDQMKIFKEAKKEAAAAASSGDDDDDDDKPPPKPKPGDDDDDDKPPSGDLDWSPPEEAIVDTPLPMFIPVPEDMGASGVKLRYKPFGGTKWLSLKMKKMKGGYGGEVPCKEISTTGKLRLFVIVTDEEGDPISTAGTRNSPLIVQIRNEIAGDQPSYPGKEPPEKCMDTSVCPPDFPGCNDGGGGSSGSNGECDKRGDKGWGATCETNCECRESLVCLNGSCEQDDGSGGTDPGGGDDGEPKNYVTLGVQLDLMAINSATQVCGQVDRDSLEPAAANRFGDFDDGPGEYLCYFAGGGGEFLGRPTDDGFNEIEGGLGFSGVRILAGYDRVLWEGLMVGGRIGVVIGGTPTAGDANERFDTCDDTYGNNDVDGNNPCNDPDAPDFDAVAIPLHAEVRASWMFMRSGLIRPYAFVGGGYGAAAAGVSLAVCDAVDEDGNRITNGQDDGRCGTNTEKRNDIEAFQVAGTGFIDFGGGAIFAFHPNFGAYAEIKMQVLLPTTGFTLSPNIGPVAMF